MLKIQRSKTAQILFIIVFSLFVLCLMNFHECEVIIVYKNRSFSCYDNTTERRRWAESQNQHEMQNAGNKTALPEPLEGSAGKNK